MKFSELVNLYKNLESTAKKLEKADILAKFYSKCTDDELYRAVVLSMGQVFPGGEEELGVANEMMKRMIMKATGTGEKEVVNTFKSTGDLGLTAERLMEKRKQRSLGKKELTLDLVFDNLRKLPQLGGKGSQEKKIDLIVELLSSASPAEAKYIVRITLGQMRTGVAAGLVRDAIALAFGQDKKGIEHMYNLSGDYGLVAEKAKKGITRTDIQMSRPITVMLAERSSGLEDAMKSFKSTALEKKYDGFRVQIHKEGSSIKIFSRRMEDVTRQFPDIVLWAKQLKPEECIVDGEAVAYDTNRKKTLPFQQLSRRIQRKYDIEKMVKEIPIQVNLFDVLYADGENFMDKPLYDRWKKLKSIVKQNEKIKLAEHTETNDFGEAKKFYEKALAAGEEGIIVKNMDAHYQPGRRVGYWLKVKPIMEPLDLVVVGAEWGEGKRANWLSSMILAARDGDNLAETGRMASGFTEEQLEELTKKLKNLIIETEGKVVKVKPEIVVEIGYEEIQKSPKYPSGYALRFPRLLRIRSSTEKGPRDADTVKTIKKLYKMQRGKKQK
jgi:DNA ligase-1